MQKRNAEELPRLWRGWETVTKIGSGAFGTVYKVEQNDHLGSVKNAAVKVIRIPQKDGDVESLRMEGKSDADITETLCEYKENLKKEYELTQTLGESEYIVHSDGMIEIPHEDGVGWDVLIKMELLTPLLKAHPDLILDEETVVQIGIDMCRALEQCKSKNVIHRDVKPQNIFRSDDGTYKLGDFGIAKTVEKTVGGTKIGTYKYMAPEVYVHQPYGSSADQYSLGLVLYWLLNERRMPFEPLPPNRVSSSEEDNAREKRFSWKNALPEPKHGSPWLKHVVLKACAYHPKDRFNGPRELRKALEEKADPGLLPKYDGEKPWKRWLMGAGAAVLLIAAIVVGIHLLGGRDSQEMLVGTWALQETEHTMQVGTQGQIKVQLENTDVLPDDAIWSSSDDKIVTVDASTGKIVAKAAGTAVITLSAGDQEEQCVVIVEKQEETLENGQESTTEPEVTAINLNAKRAKTEYFIGEDFDGSGLEIEIQYDNGDVETVSDGFTNDFDSSSPGKKTVSICYQNESVGSYQITVNKIEVSSIRVINYPVTSLTEGERLNLSGLTIEATYNNGDTKTISDSESGLSCAPVSFANTGKQTVTVSYGGATTTFDVQIAEIGRHSVSLSSSNDKYGAVSGGGTYKEGETITLTASPRSGCVFYKWSDGETSESRTFTVTKDCNLIAYFYGPLMDYKAEDEIPQDAMLVGLEKLQYQYQKKEYKTSSSKSMSGWTFDYTSSETTSWSEYSTESVAAFENEQQKREVQTQEQTRYKTQYHYYRYYGNTSNDAPYTWSGANHPYLEERWTDSELPFLRTSGGMDQYGDGYTGNGKNPYWLKCDGSQYGGSGPWTREAEDGTYTLYRYRDTYYTHHFYRYGDAYWTDSKSNSDDLNLVGTRKLYQYRLA